MKSDPELLRAYVEYDSEAAFAAIVARHVDLVYSAALRQVGFNTHLAEDAAQIAFADLARKASTLLHHPNLAGWLYTSACFAAQKLIRAEARRSAREREALLMDETNAGASAPEEWERLRPLLDAAMLQLDAAEREAIILRFFTGLSYPEIGTALALNDDTVRKRVVRALDKLHGLLGRRGFTSTAVAIGAVLSQHAVSAAPSGFARVVGGLALANAASGSVPHVGSTLITFMSTTKLGLGGLALAVLLCLSLSFTGFLVVERLPGHQSRASATRPLATPAASETVGATSAPLTMADVSRSLVTEGNLASLRDDLRAAGASEARVREVLFGILRRRYRAELSAKRLDRIERAWWLDDHRVYGISRNARALRDEPGMSSESVEAPLAKLMGPDPAKAAVRDARYSFLPAEIRSKFLQFDRDTELQWEPTGNPAEDARIDAELAQRADNAIAERARMLASLPQEVRDEYELRFGVLGTRLATQLLIVPGGTEEEFRQVYRLAKDYTYRPPPGTPIWSVPGAGPVLFNGNVSVPQPEILNRFVAALGYDRALDYVWAGSPEYRNVAALTAQSVLPSSTAGQFVQLAAETGNQALAIHHDATLTSEQRQAALLELQAAVRTRLDRVVPVEAQRLLSRSTLAWFEQLADGKYKAMTPSIPGISMVSSSSTSIGGPPPRFPTVALPQRSPNR